MLRLLGWLFGFGVFLVFAGIAAGGVYLGELSSDLPDYTVLKDYQPPVTTRVHAADGTLLAEYARERRLFQPIETVPPIVLEAFISAEDKDFYSHHGIAVDGIVRALRDKRDGQDRRQCRTAGRRLHHHAAGGKELPALDGTDLGSQDQGSDPRASHRVYLLQGQDPRALRQRDFPRAQLLRHRRGGAQLFRQGAVSAHPGPRPPISAPCPRGPTTTTRSGVPNRQSSGATGFSIGWPRTATSRRTKRTKPRRTRSTSCCAPPAASCTRPSISPRRCGASSRGSMARISSMAGASPFEQRSTPGFRGSRARR